MNEQVLGLALEFSIRTVVLAIALWAMIKFQDLESNFVGLLGSAALCSSLDMIPLVGHYIAVIALWLCLMKATNGDVFPDIALTVAIGYALMFCLSLFVLGSRMGNLRPSHKHTALAPPAMDAGSHSKPEPEVPPKVNEPTPVVAARAPDPLRAPQASSPPATKSAREVISNFSIKGIIEGIDKPVGTINSGLRNYSLVAGETRSMETKDGRIKVRFDGVRDHQAILTISGEQIALAY